ncbi:MAG: hypothetical protein V4726_07430 [Verrucomicrobiota bacterium]
MAWPYLRAAVFHRWRFPVLGEVPVNLAALGLFGVLGLDNPVFWAVGGGFEAVWLALTAGRTGYRRKVDAVHRRQAWKRVEERRLALYNQLPPGPRHRHHVLRAACQELTRVSPGSDPEATAEVFTWLHLKLLLARETLAAGRETAPDDDLHGLHARAVLDLSDPAAARLAEQAVSLLESRRHHAEESARRLAHVDEQILRIEAEIASARQRHPRDHTPHDFRHSLSLAGGRLRGDLAALDGNGPVAEVDSLLSGLAGREAADNPGNGSAGNAGALGN